MKSSTKQKCKDCVAEGVKTNRKIKGLERCATHLRALKKTRRNTSWETYIKVTYNLTPEEYWALYEFQGGVCYICRIATGKGKKKLSIDHDHKCCKGKVSCGMCVRGLLCSPCNVMLGRARDVIAFFERAIEYLKNPPAYKLWRR